MKFLPCFALFIAVCGFVPVLGFAEGVWVLWRHEVIGLHGRMTGAWGIVDTMDSRRECETRISAIVSEAAKDPRVKVETSGWSYTSQDGQSAYVRYFKCLPDTVDPRAPKGK